MTASLQVEMAPDYDDDGGAAFPVAVPDQGGWFQEGLTARDYFAACALQGLLSNPKLQEQILAKGGADSTWVEESAYAWAAGMLKARAA